jgi:hypothetical protein
MLSPLSPESFEQGPRPFGTRRFDELFCHLCGRSGSFVDIRVGGG